MTGCTYPVSGRVVGAGVGSHSTERLTDLYNLNPCTMLGVSATNKHFFSSMVLVVRDPPCSLEQLFKDNLEPALKTSQFCFCRSLLSLKTAAPNDYRKCQVLFIYVCTQLSSVGRQLYVPISQQGNLSKQLYWQLNEVSPPAKKKVLKNRSSSFFRCFE